ncbi:MAG: acyl carrier protein [Chloroflexi bacterium]|nr:acyl carrier protein [Chloroflexota bacterium]
METDENFTKMLGVVLHVLQDMAGPDVAQHATPSDGLVDDLGLESFALVTLQVSLEKRLGIRFDPLEADLTEVFDTVGSLARYLSTLTDQLGDTASKD